MGAGKRVDAAAKEHNGSSRVVLIRLHGLKTLYYRIVVRRTSISVLGRRDVNAGVKPAHQIETANLRKRD
jgi:hypothetical protein